MVACAPVSVMANAIRFDRRFAACSMVFEEGNCRVADHSGVPGHFDPNFLKTLSFDASASDGVSGRLRGLPADGVGECGDEALTAISGSPGRREELVRVAAQTCSRRRVVVLEDHPWACLTPGGESLQAAPHGAPGQPFDIGLGSMFVSPDEGELVSRFVCLFTNQGDARSPTRFRSSG